jgi:hypothetical protein
LTEENNSRISKHGNVRGGKRMQNLYLFQEVPNTELSWMLFGLMGVFIVVIIIGSLTYKKKENVTSRSNDESGKTSRKSTKNLTGKKYKK